MAADVNRLQFVGADHLLCGRTAVEGWEFQSATGRYLGTLAGILMDAASRTIRYFVIEGSDSTRPARQLVSFCPVRVDWEARALRAQVSETMIGRLRSVPAIRPA